MRKSMFVTVDTSITVKVPAEAIWDYAIRPDIWTASNPEEHFGLEFDSPDNLPGFGVAFHQKESVAGLVADLHGQFHFFDRPKQAVWSGTACYKLLGGLFRIYLAEGGILKLKQTAEGVQLSHNVYIDFPRSLAGKVVHWFFLNRLNGVQAVHDHTYKELVFFKEQLEKGKR